MPNQSIANPYGALRKMTTFVGFKSDDGDEVSPGQARVFNLRANAAIAKGEVLMWVVPTATLPVSVTPMTAAAVDNLFVGVARHAAAAGEDVTVVTEGFCFVDVAAETAAFGNPVTMPATTTGKAEIGATFDATLVVGSYLGTALGAKDAANLAPVWIHQM